ncbi:hypothetical protein ACFQY5_29725 [Paeniroseomonas aquatica]|uniref:hypothetical protein n=1 Tax=Paeniroseomonas aquatica TaxID=373043 RepID=UPI00360C2B44
MSIRVGIVGISGFGGGEALRLVAGHPSFELVHAAGEGSAGSRLEDRFPGVSARLAGLVIERWDPATLPALDVLFASLPTGASAEALARVPKAVKIVDIGGTTATPKAGPMAWPMSGPTKSRVGPALPTPAAFPRPR